MNISRSMLWPLRKAAEWYLRHGYYQLAALHGAGGSSSSGITINEDAVMRLSAAWACTRVIADPVGFLPLHLYQRQDAGRAKASSHSLYRLLHDSPNGIMTATTFRQSLQAQVLNWGNAYAQIVRRSGGDEIVSLWPIHPASVTPKFDGTAITYDVAQRTGQTKTYQAKDIFHLAGLGSDGISGHSVITMARDTFGLSLAADKYGSTFFANGGRVPYLLKVAQKFASDEKFSEFSERWKKAYRSADAFHNVPILEGGIEYQQIGIKPEDAQLLLTRQFQIPEICRWYKVQPHLVADLSRSTNNNIEHQGLEFVQQTLGYWLKVWEQAIWLRLLSEREQERYYAEFSIDYLLRGDFQSRMAGYATALQNGWMNRNEVRSLENMNPIEDGGDIYTIQLNMQSLPGQTPTSAQVIALNKISQGGSTQ